MCYHQITVEIPNVVVTGTRIAGRYVCSVDKFIIIAIYPTFIYFSLAALCFCAIFFKCLFFFHLAWFYIEPYAKLVLSAACPPFPLNSPWRL